MGGMTMWIVLGSLIGVVVIFLVITSILDRKKNKKIHIQKENIARDVEKAGVNIAKKVTQLVKANQKLLNDFVPSVGKYTMSDINKKAKDALEQIKNSRDYKLLKHVDKRQEEFNKYFLPLIKEKSNNWDKRNQESITFFKDFKIEVKEEPENKKKFRIIKKGEQ